MGSVFTSMVVDRVFEPRSRQTKDNKIVCSSPLSPRIKHKGEKANT